MSIVKLYMNTSATTMNRFVELAVGVVCALVAYWKFGFFATDESAYRVVQAFAGVSGTLLGFLIAGLSILTAVIDRRAVINLRRTGHYDGMLHEVYWASAWYLVSLILSLICLFFAGQWLIYGMSITTGTMVFATLLFVSAGRKFSLVMKLLQ